MGRKSAKVVQAEINELRRVLESPENRNKTDTEIMADLNIKRPRFYHYKAKMREQDREAWLEIAKESVEERSLKIMKALDFALQINKEIAETSPNHMARIQAAYQVVQNNVWALQLLERGPKIMPKLEGKIINIEPEVQEPIRQPTV